MTGSPRLAGVGLAILLLGSIGFPVSAAPSPEDARFQAIYSREWAWRREQFPEMDADDDTAPISAHLSRVDPASQANRLAYWTRVMAELDSLRLDQLSAENQIDLAVYRDQIAAQIADERFADYEAPLNSDSTFWTDLGFTSRRPFRQPGDYDRYISQLREFPRYFDQQIDNMRAGLKRGFTPPRITLEGRDLSVTAITEAPTIEANPFYAPFKDLPTTMPGAEQARLRLASTAAIREAVVPAHRALLAFLRNEYLPAARVSLAAEALPDGKAYYQSKIREFTTLDLTPEQIHTIGLADVAKIHAQMVSTMRETGFTGDFPAFLAFLRSDPRFYAKTPEELLMRAAFIAKGFDAKAAQYFGYLPRSRFAIKPVPPELAPFYTSGRGGPGIYLLNTYDLPSRPLYSLGALTLHESAPGHAWQMAISLEHKNQPEFRRKGYISAYGEGWAVYCEKLGLEMGLYPTAYDRFGMLTYQMWRAARLVVDTGIHAQGWSREQARAYLRDNTALSEREIDTEIDRYITWPGQALSYYLGAMTIELARAKAEAALGPRFNIRAFHDAVLELGSVPLPVVTQRIDRFIAEGGRGPYPDME
ncbi:MAG: DUF885 family protein [Caulobacteraceae bacterium]